MLDKQSSNRHLEEQAVKRERNTRETIKKEKRKRKKKLPPHQCQGQVSSDSNRDQLLFGHLPLKLVSVDMEPKTEFR